MNFPVDTYPGSQIEAAISTRPEATMARSLQALHAVGGVSSIETLTNHWPEADEAQVVTRICRGLKIYDSYSHYHHLELFGDKFDGTPVRVADAPVLLEGGLRGRPKSLLVLGMGDRLGFPKSPVANAFEKVAREYPQDWQSLTARLFPEKPESEDLMNRDHEAARIRDGCARAMMALLFDGLDPKELYPVRIGLHEASALANPDKHESIWKLEWEERRELVEQANQPLFQCALALAALPAESQQSHEALERFFEAHSPEALRNSLYFSEGTAAAKRAILLGYLLEDECEEDRGEMLNSAAGFPHNTLTALREPLLLQENEPVQKQIWRAHFDRNVSTGFDTWGALDRLRGEAERMYRATAQRSSRPFARFMAQQTGRVTARSSSGDFESYREYTPGDDTRRIDYKLYARTDKYYVKQYTEREEPPIVFLVDAEYLEEGYRERRNQDRDEAPDSVHENLAEFYRCLFFSQIAGVTPHVRINGRGFNIESYSDEDMKRLTSPIELDRDEDELYGYREYRTTEGEFLYNRLVACLSADHNLEGERKLFGEAGFGSFGILDGGDTDLPRGADVLAFIHPRNLEASMPQLAAINGGREIRVYGQKNARYGVH